MGRALIQGIVNRISLTSGIFQLNKAPVSSLEPWAKDLEETQKKRGGGRHVPRVAGRSLRGLATLGDTFLV